MRAKKAKILIIDDEQSMVDVLDEMLSAEGYDLSCATDPTIGLKRIEQELFDLVITDLRMTKCNGIDILKVAKKKEEKTVVILITAYASVENAIEAMKQGAYEYVSKPFKMDELRLLVKRGLEYKATLEENVSLRRALKSKYSFEEVIGKSKAIQDVLEVIEKILDIDATVLVHGESGTGKEVIARAIHFNSLKAAEPFVTVNCGAMPETLLASELFGHEKGSFTGAVKEKPGLFEVAHGGTIFLDEVGSTSPQVQVHLLRVMQEKEIVRVGGTRPIKVDVRVIAATNEDLPSLIQSGKFREDLFYRLNIIPIHLAPLRDRREDIPLLVKHFLKKLDPDDSMSISQQAMPLLMEYDWPGNVRELENFVERAFTLCEGSEIGVEDFPEVVSRLQTPATVTPGSLGESVSLRQYLEQVERNYISRVLLSKGQDKRAAADTLGIDLATLYRKIERYQI